MKANELRHGSVISINGKFVIVDHIKSHDYSTTINDGFTIIFNDGTLETDDDDNIEPIPLTPEILEKCGFKKDGKYNSANRWMGIFNQPLIECNGYFTIPNYPLNEIKYLHQLQNLYFALTGEELEVNL